MCGICQHCDKNRILVARVTSDILDQKVCYAMRQASRPVACRSRPPGRGRAHRRSLGGGRMQYVRRSRKKPR